MEGEIIPMCEDQGMAIVPWSALGSGQLLSAEQRQERANDPDALQATPSQRDLAVSEALEKIASAKGTSFQAIVSGNLPLTRELVTNSALGTFLFVPSVGLCVSDCRRKHCRPCQRHVRCVACGALQGGY